MFRSEQRTNKVVGNLSFVSSTCYRDRRAMRKTVALDGLGAAGLGRQRVDGLQSVFRGESALVSNAAVAVDRGAALARDGLRSLLRRSAREIDGSPLQQNGTTGLFERNAPPERERDLDAEREEPEEEPVIVSIARETWIQAAPRWSSSKPWAICARVRSSNGTASPRVTVDAKEGGIALSRRYVCVSLSATTDRTHPVAQLSTRVPRDGCPGLRGHALPHAASFARLPTLEQQRVRAKA